MLPWSPGGGRSGGRSRPGICLRMSGSGSRTCARAGRGCGRSRSRLGRSPSTISRELRRNRDPGSGQYRPFTAHKLAAQRRARPRAGKIARDEVLRLFVQDRLEKRWSPEQISQALRRGVPGRPGAACRARDDLPGGLPPRAGRPVPRAAGPGAADRQAPPQAAPPAGRAPPERDHRHDDDRSAARRGRRPQRAGALGRRPDHRGVQPVGDRHPGGPGVAVHDLAAPARPAHRRGGPRRADRRCSASSRRSCAGR